jgi:hypothetical protein
MTLNSALYYWLICDRCGVSSTEDSEVAAWSDIGSAYLEAGESEWHFDGDIGQSSRDVCADCHVIETCPGCGEPNGLRGTGVPTHDERLCAGCVAEATP